MRVKVIAGSIITIFIILLTTIVFAATGTVELRASVNQVEKGDTFTVTLSAASEDGINGLDTKFVYNSNQLELISENLVDDSKWTNIGTSPNITVICNSTQNITSANIYVLEFKVKDSVTAGDTIKIETTDIVMDTDVANNSEITISAKKVELTVIEKLNISLNNYSEKNINNKTYLENIAPGTTIEGLMSNITTNGTIEVYKNNQKITDTTVKMSTGMKLKISLNDENYECIVIVKGDTSGDGSANLEDIFQINKHRLNKKLLENEFLLAGDVNSDNEVDIKDLLLINKFRLGKTETL